MELSESTKEQKSKSFSYIRRFVLTWFGILLIILIFSYLIYIIERYVLFYPINKFLKLVLNIFISSEKISKNKNIFIFTIIIIVLIHIKFFQIIIISIIFISGGILSRFYFYKEFIKIINQQISNAKELSICLFLSNKKDMIKYYSNILLFQKVLNINKQKENKTFIIKQFQFSEILNNIISLFEQFKSKNYQDENIQNNLINKLNSYQKAILPYTQFSYFDKIFKFNYNKTQSFLKELFINSFKNRVCENINISQNFNAYIIYPEKNNENKENNENININTLIIFCGQNAFCAEMFAINKENIKFFLSIKETTILLWNYSGYGSRKGFPSFSNIDKDVEDLKNFIIKNYSEYKIIIH